MKQFFALIGFVFVGAWFSISVANAQDQSAARMALLKQSKRIVFLGDSITAAGQYVAYFDAWLATQKLQPPPLVIDAGLASETVSGLSEDGHAGGKFPRPDVHERIDRILKITKPDLVFSCYGMNCGIYQPLDEQRFSRYKAGYRLLQEKVAAAGAKLIVITPPFYDDSRKKAGAFSYNELLGAYGAWLKTEYQNSGFVIDLHTAMTDEIVKRRQQDSQFHFQRDAVHPGPEGHWFMAQQIIRWFGDEKSAAAESPDKMLAIHRVPPAAVALHQSRITVLRDSYVATAGHKRPGVAAGKPLAEAETIYRGLTEQIQALQPLANP